MAPPTSDSHRPRRKKIRRMTRLARSRVLEGQEGRGYRDLKAQCDACGLALTGKGRVIPAMIHPIVRPKDFLETALSFLHLFIRPLVLISLLSTRPLFLAVPREYMQETMLLGTHHTHTRAAMRQQEMGAASPLSLETSFRNSAQSSPRERN